jgi:SAM-dependent methyltransferase
LKKNILQTIWDFIGIPFRFILFDQNWLPSFGWTTLEEERIQAVLPYIEGKLLDIGAGTNTLVKKYHNGIGVDVVDWGGGAQVVKNTAHLPFENESFDTITFIACLNHIPNRKEVIMEARRLLKSTGKVIITMIDPILGNIGHAIWWYSEDKKRGGMKKGEVGGMWTSQIVGVCQQAGLELMQHGRFESGLNHLYVFIPMKNK